MNFAHAYQRNSEVYEGHMMDHAWGHDWMLAVWMVLLLVLIVVGIVIAINYNKPKQSDSDPLNVLKARYAKGEIDEKEYKSIKKELSK
jgi:putative membrane protein